ncbi:hypothetical protein HDU92_001484 [Lobulomyces angularis]|nr:hypothetical protein HDU92_001484 [Lobulomyces angularis]
MDLLKDNLLSPLIGEKCSDSLLNFKLSDTPCVKLVISKGLGIGIVLGSSILKVPQILKIVSKKNAKGISFTSYFLETALFDESLVSEALLVQLQWFTVFLGTASKLPQTYNNWINKSTGQLSAITVFLQFVGSMARVFTTIQEVEDIAILTGFLIATFFNGVLVAQMIYYWNGSQKDMEKKKLI